MGLLRKLEDLFLLLLVRKILTKANSKSDKIVRRNEEAICKTQVSRLLAAHIVTKNLSMIHQNTQIFKSWSSQVKVLENKYLVTFLISWKEIFPFRKTFSFDTSVAGKRNFSIV
jgi:hypothetical protein